MTAESRLKIHTAPTGTGVAALGRTLPDLLYASVAEWGNAVALTDRRSGDWASIGLADFARQSELMALGLVDIGVKRGERVALFMDSDVGFCMADMACLLAGCVDVPIYLTQTDESISYVMGHSGARVLVVSTVAYLRKLGPILGAEPLRTTLRAIILADGGDDADAMASVRAELNHPAALLTFDDLVARGRLVLETKTSADGADGADADSVSLGEQVKSLLSDIQPKDLATIIYTSGTTGVPKGVMLSHENISFNAVTSFSGMTGYRRGPGGEVGLSFLPLTHVFARALYYGFLESGTSISFSTPDTIGDDLRELNPTVFAGVPRVVEKVYARFLERAAVLPKPKRKLFEWALGLARQYRIGEQPTGMYAVKLRLADRLVFSKWREGLGNNVAYIICGGAALSGELANIFAAAGIQILQGYGLTETSPVIAFNRPNLNRAGTVGVPIPEVEVAIAEDGEILTRGPHVMLGYYDAAEKTAEVIDADGWFHTGDIGEFDGDGFLRITDRKKDLFKLSTGKYVMPQPLEHKLAAEALIDQAVVIGVGRKYCTGLIFPSESALRTLAGTYGLPTDNSVDWYFGQPRIRGRFQELVDKSNAGMDHWSTIKRFKLIAQPLTIEGGLLTPTMKVKRSRLAEVFAEEIEGLYVEELS